MSNLYKIECASVLVAGDIAHMINEREGKFIVVGKAIITNFCFSDSADLNAAISGIAKTIPLDGMSHDDVELFYMAYKNEREPDPQNGEWWLCELRDGSQVELHHNAFWWETEIDGDGIDPTFDVVKPIRRVDGK